ncbi:hypothetical protein PSV08DRAFT_244398 [Bipolaris maydis]|uniref:uncharacterized protein n=1 Tax=Cochliobolus heterostrophus TaxID=5016 RepID=UPI0024D40BD4|nr:hypothetical protein J3E74DRAFT_290272 [Bipolaris maydis]KAJ6273169.1 hypothetical protein PSV08DRAFT_244398 [Bipolaris maydis]KAJ6284379.1 hypothetical protein J3E71DRAFT_237409 [Bipolaris maydis]
MRASVSLLTTFLLLCGIANAQSSPTPTPVLEPIRQLHEKPCLGAVTRPWKNYIVTSLGWNPESLSPETITAHQDSILVVDSWKMKNCARFLVFVDSRKAATTERSGIPSDEDCGDSDGCTRTGDYMEAYITLPKGKYLVDIRYAPKGNCGSVSIAYPKMQLHNQCKKEKA